MLTKNINLKNYENIKPNKKIFELLKKIFDENNEILQSLKSTYKDSYKKKTVTRYKKFSEFLLIGMGGSILGTKSIFSFLKERIKKKFYFKDNFDTSNFILKKKDKRLNLIISKSGNTLETISNTNILIKKHHENVFITENKNSYLMNLALKLKSEIIHHNNYIGGRYSILSEVGMLPAELMGLNPKKFRRLNLLIKDKTFIQSLIQNVSNILHLTKKKKFNSVIINYDNCSSDLFYWYQQLIAESLGKKGKGILPIISNMPKDNHSVMQLYLDGFKNNFYTFFFVNESNSPKINNKELLKPYSYLKNKDLNEIKFSQFKATEKVFQKKKIPFRSFFVKKKNEETLGELFIFFILETILLGKALNLNPYDQPAVELVKSETKKFLLRS